MKKKTTLVIFGYLIVMVILFFACSGSNNNATDNSSNKTEAPDTLVLTNTSKARLENYCYYLQPFSSKEDINEDYMHSFIFHSYTGVNSADYITEMINFDDIGEVSMLKIAETTVLEHFKLLFGFDMPEYKPEKTQEVTSLFYKDSHYYVSISDFGDVYYQYSNVKTNGKEATVTINKVFPDETTNLYIDIKLADNANGFIITSVRTD